MSGCQSCDSCQANCTSCQGCNSCQGTCDTCQSFCENGGQYVGSFSFGQCVSAGQIFLTKTKWNNLIDYINDAYDRGTKKDGGDSGLPSSDPNDYMTASMFNKVSSALRNLGSSYTNLSVSQGDIIYGSYFETLEDYADNLKYKRNQCNICNVDCDVSCDSCQGCNRCQGCNGSSQSISCCSSCNTCQSDNPSPA